MCVVSAVTDHYQREWGYPWIDSGSVIFKPTPPQMPMTIDFNPNGIGSSKVITAEQWEEYQRLKKAAEEIDQKTNQPDCIKPDLKEWEDRMEAFLVKKGILARVVCD